MADLFDSLSESLSEPTFATSSRRVRATPRPSRLAQTLREARQDSGLGLDDVAEQTGIRPAQLEALEAGHFADLPGDPHGKTFVRRYAQTVGLEPARVLLLYAQERRSLAAAVTPAEREFTGLLPTAERAEGATLAVHPQIGRVLRLLASLLLVAAAIWLALRAFDGALLPGGRSIPAQAAANLDPATNPAAALPRTTPPAAPAMILLSLQTTPPGAEISMDGYSFGQSPVVDAPVRAGNRTLRVERSGYGTFERTLELNQDRHLNITLSPQGAGAAAVTDMSPALTSAPTETQTPAAQQVVLSVSAEAWLEVYRGSQRGGERLVYETAQPGDVYSFAAPVYVFSGNAGGVSVARGDAPAKPLGAPGAVVGAAYKGP